jgi:hypothetical protein
MNKVLTISVLAGVLCVAGCKEKKTHDDIIAPRIETPAPSGPERMADSRVERDVQWLGKNYKVEVWRRADDSLRMVKDEFGQEFVDNRVTLTVKRSDGSIAITKTFTKQTFDAYLDAKYRREGIFDAFVFDEVDDQQLEFAASVSLPQSDEYIPLEIKIDNLGGVSIKRDSEMDTHGDEGEDMDEGD